MGKKIFFSKPADEKLVRSPFQECKALINSYFSNITQRKSLFLSKSTPRRQNQFVFLYFQRTNPRAENVRMTRENNVWIKVATSNDIDGKFTRMNLARYKQNFKSINRLFGKNSHVSSKTSVKEKGITVGTFGRVPARTVQRPNSICILGACDLVKFLLPHYTLTV